MSLPYAEVSPYLVGALHPDRAAGVENSVAFDRLSQVVGRDIFGQASAADLKKSHLGLESGVNTEVMRNTADVAGKLSPKTDEMAGIIVDSIEEAAVKAHSTISDGFSKAVGVAEDLPGHVSAVAMALGATLWSALQPDSHKSQEVAEVGDIGYGYNPALHANDDGPVPLGGARNSELSEIGKAFVKYEMHVDTMIKDMTGGELVGLAANDPALAVTEAQRFMEAKAAAQEAAFVRA